MYSWIDILVTFISSGCLFTAGTWIMNRKVNNVKQTKEIFDYYKSTCEDLQTTLQKQQDENRKLYRAISRLERAVQKINTCKHFDACPARDELQELQRNDAKAKLVRQSEDKRNKERNVCTAAAKPGNPEADAKQPG